MSGSNREKTKSEWKWNDHRANEFERGARHGYEKNPSVYEGLDLRSREQKRRDRLDDIEARARKLLDEHKRRTTPPSFD